MKIKTKYTLLSGTLLFVACCVTACYAQRFRDTPVTTRPIKTEQIQEKQPVKPQKDTLPFDVHVIEHNGKQYIVVNNSTSISITAAVQ
jgi:hypothetical protein